MKRQDLVRLVPQGEGPSLEFKCSTAELRQALETLCGFLNTKGGRVIIGVGPRGELRGQQVSDHTLQEIAQGFERFEPPVLPAIERIPLRRGLEALSLSVDANHETVPFTFLERQLPLAVHFTEGRIFREDRLLLPPEALREIILNAVMHRDYSDPSGDVAVAAAA
jgi:predicted HTH transcriptional regulator